MIPFNPFLNILKYSSFLNFLKYNINNSTSGDMQWSQVITVSITYKAAIKGLCISGLIRICSDPVSLIRIFNQQVAKL